MITISFLKKLNIILTVTLFTKIFSVTYENNGKIKNEYTNHYNFIYKIAKKGKDSIGDFQVESLKKNEDVKFFKNIKFHDFDKIKELIEINKNNKKIDKINYNYKDIISVNINNYKDLSKIESYNSANYYEELRLASSRIFYDIFSVNELIKFDDKLPVTTNALRTPEALQNQPAGTPIGPGSMRISPGATPIQTNPPPIINKIGINP